MGEGEGRERTKGIGGNRWVSTHTNTQTHKTQAHNMRDFIYRRGWNHKYDGCQSATVNRSVEVLVDRTYSVHFARPFDGDVWRFVE